MFNLKKAKRQNKDSQKKTNKIKFSLEKELNMKVEINQTVIESIWKSIRHSTIQHPIDNEIEITRTMIDEAIEKYQAKYNYVPSEWKKLKEQISE